MKIKMNYIVLKDFHSNEFLSRFYEFTLELSGNDQYITFHPESPYDHQNLLNCVSFNLGEIRPVLPLSPEVAFQDNIISPLGLAQSI